MKPSLIILTTAVALAASSSVRAETTTAFRDTYVRADNSGPNGTNAHVYVSAGKNNPNVRKGLFAFQGPTSGIIKDAQLQFTVSDWEGKSTSASFLIYGLRDSVAALAGGGNCQGEHFAENIKNNASELSFLDTSDAGVKNNSSCIFEGKALGTLTVPKSKLNASVSFSNGALARFVQANATTTVSFLVVRAAADKSDGAVGFAAREHSSLSTARLTWTKMNEIDVLDGAGVRETGNNTIEYTGALRIPLSGGGAVVVPGAEVEMVFEPSGELRSILGTVGFPELPGMGLMGALGGADTTGMSMQIAYGQPSAFDFSEELPLNQTKYFFFRQTSGASVSFGALSASSPNAGETLIALDPVAPTVYFHTDELGGSVIFDSVSIGVSGAHALAYSPTVTKGVENYITPFDGNLYLGASGGIPMAIPLLVVTVDGELVADAKVEAFPNGHWAKTIGGNADIGVEAGIGVFALSLPVGQASLMYNANGEGGTPSFAFAGRAHTPNFPNMPFQMRGQADVAGYITSNNAGKNSFVQFTGEVKLGNMFANHTMEGTTLLSGTGGSFTGKAKFGGQKMVVSGTVTDKYARFSGKMENNLNFGAGKIKTTVKAAFDTRGNGSVELSASARACGYGIGCSGTKVESLHLEPNGAVRICVKVPALGKKCQTL